MTDRTTQPADTSPFAAAIRWGSIFLLVLSAVMVPLVSSEQLSLRLVCLLLGIAGAFFWLLQAMFEYRVELPWGWPAAGGVLLLVAGLVSASFSDCPQDAAVTIVTWIGYASGFTLAVWAGRAERLRRALLCAVCAAAVPIAAMGVLQYVYLLDNLHARMEASDSREEFLERYSEAEWEDFASKRRQYSQQEWDSLKRRAASKRVFATFALPNSLAGYLLVLLPPAIALAAAALRSRRWALTALLLVPLLAFFFTFSKGGWLVALVLLALFLISQGRSWLRRRWLVAVGVVLALAAALGIGLVASPYLRTRLTGMSRELGGSARVRVEYWTAGIEMWKSDPVLGIGPGNFKNHYMRHKAVAAEEVRHAHNDYVQLLAEGGPVVLLGYLVFWLAIVVGAVRSRPEPTLSPERPPLPWLLTVAGVLAVLATGFFGGLLHVFGRPSGLSVLWILGSAALWGVTYHALRRAAANAPARPLAFGMLLAVAGLLLHSLVDLDLYIPGVAYPAFIVAGLLAAPWIRRRAFSLEGARRTIVAAAVVVVGLAFFFAVHLMCQASSAQATGREWRLSSRPADRRDGLLLLQESTRENPLDHSAFASLGATFERSRRPSDLDKAADAWQRAIALNPSYADYHWRLARLLRDRRRRDDALAEAQLAVTLAPTKPQYRILLGDLLDLTGRPEAAHAEYAAALRLNDEMVRGGAPGRQWLTSRELTALQARLDRYSKP